MDVKTATATTGATQAAVRFEHVTKRYGEVAAVEDLSFDLAGGTLVTLLGPSGCGKTTTLRLIAGLEHTSTGRILIGGADVTKLSAAERDVSMVFQSYALFPHMSVLENVCYGLRATGMPKAKAIELALTKLELVGLKGYQDRQPSELSGGQQQRVAVARAIVLEPQVLLFDEPLSNLDAKLRRRVREEIRSLQQELSLTVVYVTHDQEEALAVSDRIIILRAGHVAQDGTPRELYEAPSGRFVADFMGDANILAVEVEDSDAEWANTLLGPRRLRLPSRGAPRGTAELAIRPHDVLLYPRPPGESELSGRIAKAAYLGNHMEYRVVVANPQCELFVTSSDVRRPLWVDCEVAIAFDAAAAVLITEHADIASRANPKAEPKH